MRLSRIGWCLFQIAIVSAALGSSGPAMAQSQPDVCTNQQTTKDMRDCANQQYTEADAELTVVYTALTRLLGADRRSALVKAELAWIQYRDADCLFEASAYLGGTLAGPTNTFCLVDLVRQRAKQLQTDLLYEQAISAP